MKVETKKIERWLMANRFTNDFAAYWWPKMRDAEDKDAVAEEMRESWEGIRANLLQAFEEMARRWRLARKAAIHAAQQWADIGWFHRYPDDICESHGEVEDVFV